MPVPPGSAPRRVLITGLNGQDGGYLAELLLERGHEVVGTVRDPDAALARAGLEHLGGRVSLRHADLDEPQTLAAAVREVQPDDVYHLASPTFVPRTWEDPAGTFRRISEASAALLMAVIERPGTRALVAASGEVFGDAGESPQRETTPMRPRTPYGIAKVATHHLIRALRERHDAFLVSAICFNHESPRRPLEFLPRKVAANVAAIAAGRQETIALGDLSAVRDWSHARDVVEGFALALAAETPDDYLFSSGVAHSVDDLVGAAFAAAGISREGRVEVDPRYVRPPEGLAPVGDITKARERLGWAPRTTFQDLVAELVRADLAREGVGVA